MEKLHGPRKDGHQPPKKDGDGQRATPKHVPQKGNVRPVEGASPLCAPNPPADENMVAGQGPDGQGPDGQGSSPSGPDSHQKSPLKRRRRGAQDSRTQQVFGALDLGTNNCRLLLAHPTRRSFRVIGAFSRIIRLGEGISRNGALSEAAMVRTIEALKICAEKMMRFNVTHSRLVATQACRVAENGDEFIQRVKDDIGLKLEVIDQETEARLAVSGCASLLDRKSDGAVVFDIGGGSSELIWLDLRNAQGRWKRTIHDRIEAQSYIRAWTSLPIGVVTLAEKFSGKPVDAEVYEEMVQYVLRALEPFEAQHRIGDVIKSTNMHLLGTSGTVTTVAGVHLCLDHYQRHRVDGLWMGSDVVQKISQDLANMTNDERIAQPCIGEERADLVMAGCAILEALIRIWPCERLRVADRGLREGILAGLMVDAQG